MNKPLKCCTDYKEQELHTSVEKMYTFTTQAKENLLHKAVINGTAKPHEEGLNRITRMYHQTLSVNYESIINIAVVPTNCLQDI